MVILIVLLMVCCAVANIISIDLGTKYIKVACREKQANTIIKDISGNEKIDNMIYFSKETKIFGYYAKEQIIYSPNLIFVGISQLLGLGKNLRILQKYEENGFIYDFEETERETLKLKISPDAGYVEELGAMMLRYVYSLAVKQIKKINNKIVVSVPSSFTFTQRQALLESAKLANIHIDSIIDQTTAAAITYLMDKQEKKQKCVVLIDVGSDHTQFSVFEISKSSPMSSTLNTLTILGKAVLPKGGSNFVMGVASLIVNYITQLGYSEFLDNPEIVAEVREKSEEYMEILSTKTEVTVEKMLFMNDTVESQKITREEFDLQMDNLLEEMFGTYRKLLNDLDLNDNEISEIQFIGGASRIPSIKEYFEHRIHRVPILFDLDSDRSVVNGGVNFLLTKYNKNKKLKHLNDYINYSLHASFARNSNPSMSYFDPSKDFLARNNNFIRLIPLLSDSKIYNQTKTFEFPVRSDFSFTLKYRINENMVTDQRLFCISKFYVKGIDSLLRKTFNLLQSDVRLTFSLDPFGVSWIQKAELVLNYTPLKNKAKEKLDNAKSTMNGIYYQWFGQKKYTGFSSSSTGSKQSMNDYSVTEVYPLEVLWVDDGCAQYPLREDDIKEMTRFLHEKEEEEEKEEDWERSMEDLERMLKALEGQMWSQMMEMPEKKKKKMEYLQRLIDRIRSMISQMNALNYRIMSFMVNKMFELIQSIITSMAKMEGFV
ncbi:uncharacterized protein [Blastocystis hominis]|uniref:Uncharacterized protein n=1 Tax=Blastocystis hominis TaxID=12968 RepID=D8LV83_BLAHO|nr:uncharacterized protein [Blastocystis hominis]CBK19722.2 unnamed protein product [Blastocystis hominis]|eukprot:XP_012893770.1 uncharacterized protein [Blastocystis hominis]